MTSKMKTEYVNVPGGFASVNLIGEDAPGVPILYVHGGPGGNTSSFMPMAERISADRPVYMYDQLGSDDSNHTGEESLWAPERYIESLNTIVSSLKVKKLHIVGRSWGGMLAAEHLLRAQNSPVSTLTVTSPFFSTKLWIRDAKTRLAEMGSDALKTVEECERSNDAMNLFDDIKYQQIVKRYNKIYQCRIDSVPGGNMMQRAIIPKTASGMKVYRHMWGPSEFTCTGIMKDIDITPELCHIKIPVLFLIGEFDQVMPKTCEYYRSLVPGSRMAIIPEASQTQFCENADTFYWTFMNFLHSCEVGYIKH